MSTEAPNSLAEAIAAEYRALRPAMPPCDDDPATVFAAAHRDPEPLAALCISGGGIRSATFALGVVQGLAERGVLERFDYLSTVSGGGYLGGLLTAWAHRAGGIARVVPRLRRDAPAAMPGEPDPVAHLRDYNAYLSPQRGPLSADAWTLVATVLRNILLNWLVILPLLMLVALVPRVYIAVLDFPWLGDDVFQNAVSDSAWVRVVLPIASCGLFAFALYNILRFLPGVGGRDHTQHDFLARVLLPLGGSVLTFFAYDSFAYLGDYSVIQSKVLPIVLWTVVPASLAWIAFLLGHPSPVRRRLRLLGSPMSLAIAFMAAGTGIGAWLTTNSLLWNAESQSGSPSSVYVTVGPPTVLLGFCVGTALFMGLASRVLTDDDREWNARATGMVLLTCVAWAAGGAIVLILPSYALDREWLKGVLAAAGSVSGAVSALGGWIDPRNPAEGKPRSRFRSALARMAPPLFIACLLLAIALQLDVLLVGVHRLPGLADVALFAVRDLGGAEVPCAEVPWYNHDDVLERASVPLLLAVATALAALAWTTARYIDINTFSLHGMYRDRLTRAYLGASNPRRRAHRFTGFADDDDVPMHAIATRGQPLHVVNLTLNLVSTTRLAWQQRKAAAFTVTPLHCGSPELGYRPSVAYGGGISLGTAVAVSGAAASPNMGYHSSPVVSFIMTLFNARLGAWLGNPGPAGARTWTEKGPRSAMRSLVREALGLTSDDSEYVYLSDGGHFENLALIEMVRRRCRRIVVIDSGCDPAFTFDDLGAALRKIRIDLGIPIDFADRDLAGLRERTRRCALAGIRYSAVDGPCEDGWLLYVKPMRLGDEPPDVASYGAAHPDFPHESTNDQWFDESQTESYRMLGLFTVDELLRGWGPGDLDDLRRHVDEVYLARQSGPAEPPERARVARA